MAVIKKKYRSRQFSRLLRQLHSPAHQSLLESFFSQSGNMHLLRDDLSKTEKKQLKEAEKILKTNRGVLRMGPLLLIALPLAGFTVFSLFFLDGLVSRMLASSMEAVFSARTDITGLDVRLFEPGIRIAHLAQGDSSDPMKNLFEAENIVISLEAGPLFRGSLVIGEMSYDSLSLGTPRTLSAELDPPSASAGEGDVSQGGPEASPGTGADSAGLMQSLSGQAGDLQLSSLLPDEESMRSRLEETFTAAAEIDAVSVEAAALVERWSGTGDAIGEQIADFGAESSRLRSINIRSISDPAELTRLAAELGTALQSASGLQEQVSATAEQMYADYELLQEQAASIRNSIREDAARARSLFDDIGDLEADELMSSYLTQGMTVLFGDRAAGIMRLWDYYKRFTSEGGPSDESGFAAAILATGEKPGFREGGTDIVFPVEEYPRFLLRRLEAGSGSLANAGTESAYLLVEDLSSQPALHDKPLSFEFRSGEGLALQVEGRVDNSSAAGSSARLNGSVENIDIDISDPPRFLSLASLQTSSGLDFSVELGSRGELVLNSKLEFSGITAVPGADSALGSQISAALNDFSEGWVEFSGSSTSERGWYDTELSSNLIDFLSDSLDSYVRDLAEGYAATAAELVEQYRRDAEARLDDLLAPAENLIADLGVDLDNLDDWESELQEIQASSLNRAQQLLGEQAAEAEAAVREAAAAAEAQARRAAQEAEEAARQAAEDAAAAAAEEAASSLPGLRFPRRN